MRRINIRNRRIRASRGYTFAELMTVAVLMGLFFTIAYGVLGPLMRSATQGQAKLENVQTPAMGFYAIERDLRQADGPFTFVCDTSGNACNSGSPSAVVLAVPTAMNANGQVQLTSSGKPQWKGFIVYWTSTDPGSPNRALYRSYQAVPGISNNQPTATDAKTAIVAANPSGPVLADMFLTGDYKLSGSVSGNVVTLTMITRSTYGGATNQTTYASNVVLRNQ